MKTIGIIGFGSFGAFLADKLYKKHAIWAYDPSAEVPLNMKAPLEDVAKCDFVILAIPFEAYETVVGQIKDLLSPDTVVVDISSVKLKPALLLKKLLPDQKLVVTHPLFGPQSVTDGLQGRTIAMCPEPSDSVSYTLVKEYCTGLGLNVVEKKAEDHDKDMAYAQGLTFFVARALMRMNIHAVELQTPSFKKLLDLAELESHHSDELFATIQKGNDYTKQVRVEFTSQIEQIMSELAE